MGQNARCSPCHGSRTLQGAKVYLFRKTNRLILSDADIWGEVLEVVDGVVLVFESPAEEAALCLVAFISKLGSIGTPPPFIVFQGTGQSGSTVVLGAQQYKEKDAQGKALHFADAIKRAKKSPNYTTQWDYILMVGEALPKNKN